MQLPPMLQGDSLTRLLQGAAGGAIVTMIVGFQWGGWLTGGTAANQAKEAEQAAIVRVLAPICVDRFQHAADASANLVQLQKAELVESRRHHHQGRVDDFPRLDARSPGGAGLREPAQSAEVTLRSDDAAAWIALAQSRLGAARLGARRIALRESRRIP